jgi:hypothetical protein
MKKILAIALFISLPAFAGNHDPQAIAKLLASAKLTLLQGIEAAEKTGAVTSAKFEIGNDGKLVLSVYTVPEGLNTEPEKAALTELSADPTVSPLKYVAEVFTDKEHIARASVHMTLFQLSPFSLKRVVEIAEHKGSGTALDVRNPMIRNKRPLADVIVMDEYGSFWCVTVDLLSGKVDLKSL